MRVEEILTPSTAVEDVTEVIMCFHISLGSFRWGFVFISGFLLIHILYLRFFCGWRWKFP